jgi:NAD(P)-dependent dehydrogenase (short-subunit alcohol dehydrogenase family)
MDPKPDHGETSYKGSGRLTGKRALITGGDSGMGRAAAIAFAREGANVAINYFPSEEPDAPEVLQLIRAAGRKGFGIPGDIRSEAFCADLVAHAVEELGGLDILVSNYAPFWIIRHSRQRRCTGARLDAAAGIRRRLSRKIEEFRQPYAPWPRRNAR